MQQYKFRGKRIDNGQWVYGFYVSSPELPFNESKHFIVEFIGIESGEPIFDWHEVIPNSAGIATPRKDKKGNIIFTGDIVDKGIGEIFWDENACQYRVRWHETTFRRIRGSNPNYKNGEPLFANSEIVWEVIGNLTDNPELITPNKNKP